MRAKIRQNTETLKFINKKRQVAYATCPFYRRLKYFLFHSQTCNIVKSITLPDVDLTILAVLLNLSSLSLC